MLTGYFRVCFQSICCVICSDINISLGPWIIQHLTHRSSWQYRDVVNSQRASALIMKGGAASSPKCQCSCRFSCSRSLWETQSQHLLSQPLPYYLPVLWTTYIPHVVSLFYSNQFWTNRKKERCLTKCTTGATPQPPCSNWLPPSAVCQGTGAVILCSLIPRISCPTIAKLQTTDEDNSKEGMGLGQVSRRHRIWEVRAVRELWHFQRDVWEMYLPLAPMELQIQQELRPPVTGRSSIFSFPPSFHWHT